MQTPINVTPLIDVVLVLLIIFMVITPMMHADVLLPEVDPYEPPEGEPVRERVDVVVDERGLISFMGSERSLDEVEARVRALVASGVEPDIRLKGDRRLEAQAVLPVLEVLRAAGARRIALGVEERTP